MLSLANVDRVICFLMFSYVFDPEPSPPTITTHHHHPPSSTQNITQITHYNLPDSDYCDQTSMSFKPSICRF